MGKVDIKEILDFLGHFDPVWALAMIATGIICYRSPTILREILTGIREHKRVSAEIRRKQEAAERQIAAKRLKNQRRATKKGDS